MKVRMKVNLTGTRDGVEWPRIGGEVVLPDAEGALLCANGMAEPVAEPDPVERAVAPAAEKRTRSRR